MMTSSSPPRIEPGSRDALPSTSRYELLVRIASGGMATVYVGRSRARGGITRLFAVKRAHPHLLEDAIFRRMFVEEARLASRIHHPNVVAVQDVEELDDELLLVMDYVEGCALADLRARKHSPAMDAKTRMRIATRVVLDACAGLYAAHELRADDGTRLELVHRDVSPHNVLLGVDGIGRLTDFGIAKRATSTTISGATATGGLKGKVAYMSPEYIESSRADQRSDIFALGIVLWETLTGERLFRSESEIEMIRLVYQCEVPRPSSIQRLIPPSLDAVVLKALEKSPNDRFPTALAFAEALERVARETDLLATHREVGAVVVESAQEVLAARRATIKGSLAGSLKDDDDGTLTDPEYQGHERTATFSQPQDHDQDQDQRQAHAGGLENTRVERRANSSGSPPPQTSLKEDVGDLEATRSSPLDHPTLIDPTMDAPTFAVPAAVDQPAVVMRRPVPPKAKDGSTRAVLVLVGVLAILAAWFGGKRIQQKLWSDAASPTSPTSPTTATTAADPATFDAGVLLAQPQQTTVWTSSPEVPPSVAASSASATTTSRPPHRPKPKPTAPTTEAPTHAPPNPYKDAGR